MEAAVPDGTDRLSAPLKSELTGQATGSLMVNADTGKALITAVDQHNRDHSLTSGHMGQILHGSTSENHTVETDGGHLVPDIGQLSGGEEVHTDLDLFRTEM